MPNVTSTGHELLSGLARPPKVFTSGNDTGSEAAGLDIRGAVSHLTSQFPTVGKFVSAINDNRAT